MKNEVLGYILGNVEPAFLVAFYLFALFGVVLSMLLHYGKKKQKSKFSFKFWIADNMVRFLTSVMCIFVVVRFFDQLPIDMELNMFLAVVVGASLDQVIILVRNKTQINIFQK